MKKITAVLVGGAVGLSLAACGTASETFKDADVAATNDGSAETINMPDGFSNVATKCDHGNRVYTIYHASGDYGAIAVVPQDPSCGGASQ